MSRARPPESRVGALLGPTNTGKTHRAIERMLAHDTGMIGLPLRLLAREVYDRVVARVGVQAVALVTGEEKKIPPEPRYFVCTVEAMPLDRRVAFLAVDEAQLAGDRNRGHTFTDRILHARGTLETLFLGAGTLAPLLERIVPGVRIESAPRLSSLTWAGSRKITSVPPRSAIVAFSAEQVYEHAHRLRAVHGGTAVVLGALSPRTRNAQVAMYQAGEVSHLVATDAIGMGLNMDIAHVAFTATRKYDGRGHRDLSAAELAQIAGRAGRYTANGTFGTSREVGDLDPELVAAIEKHQFPALEQLYWRNADLDYDSPEGLLASLRTRPPFPFLVPMWGEVDELALESVLRDPAIRALAADPAALARLWAVCQIPDYRKTDTGQHVELLADIARHLLGPEGTLPDAFLERHVRRLDRTDGDFETLMARIAWIRTFTYVAWQRDWTRSAARWQAETSAIEDRLSDALHDRLTDAFVDRRVALVVGGATGAVSVEGEAVKVGGVEVGRLREGTFEVGAAPPPKAVLQAIRRRLRSEILPLLLELETSPDAEITVADDARLHWRGQPVGRLTGGADLRSPKVVLGRWELLDPTERERMRVRLQGWRDRAVASLTAMLERKAAGELERAGKGLVHELERGLGSVDREAVEDLVRGLTEAERKALAKLDVRVGIRTVYVQSMVRPASMALRGALWSLLVGRRPLIRPPADGRTSAPVGDTPEGGWRAMGFRVLGPLAVRVDVLEQVSSELRAWARAGKAESIDRIASRLGCARPEADAVCGALGFQIRRTETDVAVRRVGAR